MNWLPIKNYEGLYEVSDTGLVRNSKGQIRSAKPNKNVQYLQIDLYKQNIRTHKYIHRLVAETFIPNPNNLSEINHIDGNKQNNLVSNLEWVSKKENAEHAIRTGLKTYKTRLSEEKFLQILERVIQGENYLEICNDPDVPYNVPFLSTKIKALAKKYNREAELKEALRLQKIKRAQVNGIKNRNFRRIGMFSKNSEFIKEFSSITEAAEYLNTKNVGSISNALHGRQKHASGYIWKFL